MLFFCKFLITKFTKKIWLVCIHSLFVEGVTKSPDSFIMSLIMHSENKTRLHWNTCLNVLKLLCFVQNVLIIVQLLLCRAASLPGDKLSLIYSSHWTATFPLLQQLNTHLFQKHVCQVQTFHTVTHRGNMSLWYFRKGQKRLLADKMKDLPLGPIISY